ncbi:hypothetical protein ANCCAN_23713 [Ancylostoma caninum]|uniref:Uncharacterized protein n=1 Tax=Ancylostoma caninum TaxID=29170 RepID=A0A368FK17_ANCCA|nr:hypothetical protein ANCCAN_23713 [Ancylostoma caninum]
MGCGLSSESGDSVKIVQAVPTAESPNNTASKKTTSSYSDLSVVAPIDPLFKEENEQGCEKQTTEESDASSRPPSAQVS